MGASAGGMMPVVYTLLAEIMPPRSRSWVLVLVGGAGLVGGYLAASFVASVFEPGYGWRSLWLQGFPTGILLLLLARFIPESPEFLLSQGRTAELEALGRRFGIVAAPPSEPGAAPQVAQNHRRVTTALVLTGLAWSFVNFGLLLWLPSDLQDRGYSSAIANGIIAKSALIALPTVAIAAFLYSRWSSKWTLVGSILLTAISLAATLLIDAISSEPAVVIAVVALLIIGSNAVIAVLLPYAAENYRLGVRGRGTGTVAGASKLGGVAVQGAALLGFVPTFGAAALALIIPMAGAAALVAYAGTETRGRSLRELESETG
jgi:putative MFS transporter